MPGQKEGAEGFKIGNLRRELDTVAIANITGANLGAGTRTVSLDLSHLSGQLKLSISVGFDAGTNKLVAIPATGATFQITPYNQFKDGYKVYGRPVFQDPTNTTNTNAPQPQQVPFSWEGSFTMASGAQIDVTFNLANWGAAPLGTIVVQVALEYDGHWWDVQAIEYALSQPILQQKDPITVGTGGG